MLNGGKPSVVEPLGPWRSETITGESTTPGLGLVGADWRATYGAEIVIVPHYSVSRIRLPSWCRHRPPNGEASYSGIVRYRNVLLGFASSLFN